jgi:chloride channel protein, CIC family
MDQIKTETKENTNNRTTAVRSEMQEFLSTMHQRRRVFPRAALVGLGAGLIAALFRVTLAGGDDLRNALIAWSHQSPFLGWVFPVAFSLVGAIGSVALVRRFAPEAAGSGIPFLKGVLHRLRTLSWRRLLPVKFLAGVLSIGGGLALGREGPTVQMGGSIGDAVADWLKSAPEERRTLIAAGAGAGLAAAFNAPLAGVIFVLEEIRRDFHPIVFGAAFLAAAIADIVVGLLSGTFPVFSIPSYPSPPILSLPFFAVLGILAGVLGVLYNKSLLYAIGLFARADRRWKFASAALAGAAVGLVGWFSPILIGGGHSLAELLLAGNVALALIPLYFLTRYVLSISSYATGAAGGIFAPLLGLGALIGLGVGEVAHQLIPAAVPQPAVFAVVGMAAYFTAIVRAPLTGIVLIVEMTGNYEQMLPLLVTCFCAYAVAEVLKDIPIYEALLERDLSRAGDEVLLREPIVIDFEVQRGAPFAGQAVRALGLPTGCVLVRAVESGREFVPTAFTRLEPHMRITAFIAPDAPDALEILRRGCKTAKRERLGQTES